ncbi:transcriptional regulator, Crp/Fnr family [Gottschalkia purinilytica]|uniref:Transcriptional regulator, Crp/Fnr family n=1 Tax=Gottschalkia purinilytica TaxID=1503 RepID=A0A0L0WD71_GOTPU|nr:Crp/Fnr family transcriptional regulator [Gottschalkia purinilytica]KNF09375.1 transcriptional regulator, Crp/Fnr family [Gottschalkia purinilytica]
MITNEYLRKIPLFSQLNDNEIEKVKLVTKERFFKRGNIVISEGSKGEAVYIIKTGKVKIYKTDSSGREVILDIKGEGKMFAEVTLFSDMPNPATVMTIEDSYIYTISNIDIEDVIKNNPVMALEIIKVLNKRLQEAQSKVKNIVLNDTYVRTAYTLIKLSQKYGIKLGDKIELDLSITREELASLVGTSRETVSRALSQFNKEKSIEIKGRKIIISDINKLKEWLN